MNSNKNYGSGALSELRDLIQEYKNLENNFNEGGEEQACKLAQETLDNLKKL